MKAVTSCKPDARFEPARSVDVPAIVLDYSPAAHFLGRNTKITLDAGLAFTWTKGRA